MQIIHVVGRVSTLRIGQRTRQPITLCLILRHIDVQLFSHQTSVALRTPTTQKTDRQLRVESALQRFTQQQREYLQILFARVKNLDDVRVGQQRVQYTG